MADLLSRLLTLTGPDRAVDAEIALANGWIRVPDHIYWRNPDGQICHEPPRYTEIINDVLIPPRWYWNIDKDGLGFHVTIYGDGKDILDIEGDHETSAAIALLIAWQKAKGEQIMPTARDIISDCFRSDEEPMMYDAPHANADRVLSALDKAGYDVVPRARYEAMMAAKKILVGVRTHRLFKPCPCGQPECFTFQMDAVLAALRAAGIETEESK